MQVLRAPTITIANFRQRSPTFATQTSSAVLHLMLISVQCVGYNLLTLFSEYNVYNHFIYASRPHAAFEHNDRVEKAIIPLNEKGFIRDEY